MEEKNAQIPYFAHEGMLARMERTVKRLWIAVIVAVLLIFASNALWLWYMSGFDIESYDYTQDGKGVNIIGDSNGVDYDVPEVKSGKTEAQKEESKKKASTP